jgi:ribonuclease D
VKADTPELIAEPKPARAAAARLSRAPRVAFDTEGDGMFRYRTRLCAMQLAAHGEVALIDTLAFDALPLFGALLGDEGPEKIVHDLSFDARVLYAHGVRLGRVFDTAVAARFLGLKSTGLSSLLSAFFGVELPKHKQQADWGERPLDDEALRYLIDDVRYLEALADELLARVRAQDIEPEVREECAYMLREAQTEPTEVPPWTRLRGAALRQPKERARLYELFAEREQLARELDLPPGRLVPNELLGSLAHREQVDEALIARVLGKYGGPHASRFHAALVRAGERADAPEHEVLSALPKSVSPAELQRKKQRKRSLTELRAREATSRGVDVQVVLPGHCLNDIAELEELSLEQLRAVPGFGECRVQRYGERMVSDLTPVWHR